MMDDIVKDLNSQHKALMRHYRNSGWLLSSPTGGKILDRLAYEIDEIVAIGDHMQVPLDLWWLYLDSLVAFEGYVVPELPALRAKANRLHCEVNAVIARIENLTDGRSFGEPEEVDA